MIQQPKKCKLAMNSTKNTVGTTVATPPPKKPTYRPNNKQADL